jgi:acyl-coenzyme A thioesterase PaaI-like protein
MPGDIVSSHYRWCVGCGADHPAGLHMRVVAGEGMAMTSVLDVGDYHQGAPGLAHGGVIATSMDEAMGVLNRLLMTPAVTVHLEVDYVRPVPVGTTLHIRTEIMGKVGRKLYTAGTARLNDPEGAVAVEAAALFLQVPLEHFVDHGSPEHIQAAIRDRPGGADAWRREVNP